MAEQTAVEFLRELAIHFNQIDPTDWNGGDVVEYLTIALQARGIDINVGAEEANGDEEDDAHLDFTAAMESGHDWLTDH